MQNYLKVPMQGMTVYSTENVNDSFIVKDEAVTHVDDLLSIYFLSTNTPETIKEKVIALLKVIV